MKVYDNEADNKVLHEQNLILNTIKGHRMNTKLLRITECKLRQWGRNHVD